LINQFVRDAIPPLQLLGYDVEDAPQVSGVSALLYAKLKKPASIGPVKFDTHLLFVDWDNTLFGRIESLDECRKKFSAWVNQGYKTPRAWRMRLPNLAVVGLSEFEVPLEVIQFVNNDYRVPWTGGETGQTLIIDLKNKLVHQHGPQRLKQYGSTPLFCAADDVNRVCAEVFGGVGQSLKNRS